MKFILVSAIVFITSLRTEAQEQYISPDQGHYAFLELYQLDSLGHSNSTGRYFGALYFSFLQSIEKQLEPFDPKTRELVRRFEKIFARFYIEACAAHRQNQPIAVNEWSAYFSNQSLQPIQYKLLGTNAHLNGALWQALTNTFSMEEMGQLKKEFVIFKKSLNHIYKLVYAEAVTSNQKLKNLATVSLGFSEVAGNFYLYKWRRRQMRLARLYWSQSPRYTALVKKVDRKKRNIDRLIIETL